MSRLTIIAMACFLVLSACARATKVAMESPPTAEEMPQKTLTEEPPTAEGILQKASEVFASLTNDFVLWLAKISDAKVDGGTF